MEDQIAGFDTELAMLRQADCAHPDYLAMMRPVDERRDEKITYENRLYKYKIGALNNKTVAERCQLQSQYFQAVREIRHSMLEQCHEHIFQVQEERRNWGRADANYITPFTTKKSQQVQNQSAYNLEVSILSGIAKYVGFPAAPDINGAKASDLDNDLAKMGISTTAPTSAPLVRPLAEPSRADRMIAEEQFISSTPWANPQHPVNQSNPFIQAAVPQRQPSNPLFATPAKRIVDGTPAVNGSASTIELVPSNPPSSAVQDLMRQQIESASSPSMPVKEQVKQPPTSDIRPTVESHLPESTRRSSASHLPSTSANSEHPRVPNPTSAPPLGMFGSPFAGLGHGHHGSTPVKVHEQPAGATAT